MPSKNRRARRSVYANISPVDFRYYVPAVAKHLSEEAFIDAKLRVMLTAVQVWRDHGKCLPEIYAEIARAAKQIRAAEVYDEEYGYKRKGVEKEGTGHDIQALINCLYRRISDAAKPWVHRGLTSFDVVDPANSWRFKQAFELVVLPDLLKLMGRLHAIVQAQRATVCIGRTHGKQAVPITMGFTFAWHLDNIGNVVEAIRNRQDQLVGKCSGAVGGFHGLQLLTEDPQRFERDVLHKLGLLVPNISTQIVQPQHIVRLLLELTVAAGVIGNLANDLRRLQSDEIGECAEEFTKKQVGSSAMPHKRNPVACENIVGMCMLLQDRTASYLRLLESEHQRDLRASIITRTFPETVNYFVYAVRRLTGVLAKLRFDEAAIERNLGLKHGLVLAEPLQVLLKKYGHADAHEQVRLLTLQAEQERIPFGSLVEHDEGMAPYLESFSPHEREVVTDPHKYVGLCEQIAARTANYWGERLKLAA